MVYSGKKKKNISLVTKMMIIKYINYSKEFLKTKIWSYGDEATDFHDKEIPKIGSNYARFAVILIDFVLKKDKNYNQDVF